MAVYTEATAATSTPVGAEATYISRGLTLAGLTEYGALWEDFEKNPNDNGAPAGWSHFPSAGSAAVTNFLAGTVGGVSRMKSGTTAASSMDQYTNVYITHQGGTARWYYACRMRIPTAVDAQVRCIQMVRAGTNVVGVGFNGLINATNFIAYYDGDFNSAGTALSLAAVDTNWHILEMWVAGDNILRARIDGGTTVVAGGVMAASAADAYLYHLVRNGTTAADRHMDRDWCLALYPRS